MTQLQVAKNLLLEANARIFELECRSADQANTIDDLETEVHRVKEMLHPRKQQKRKRSPPRVHYQSILAEDDASDTDELSLDPSPPRNSRKQATRTSKHARLAPDVNATLRTQLAETQQQLEQQIQETNAAKRELHRALTAFPLSEPSAGSALSPGSPAYSSSATLSSESYAPGSPAFSPAYYDSRSSTPEQGSPTSPTYFPKSPSYHAEGNMMSPQQFEQERFEPDSPTFFHSRVSTPEQVSPTSPTYAPESPAYAPNSPAYYAEGNAMSPQQFSPTSPPYSPGGYIQDDMYSPMYVPASPAYGQLSPQFKSMSPEYGVSLTSPPYYPMNPVHDEEEAAALENSPARPFNSDDL